jgi:predicted DNA-binding protein
MKRLHIMLPEQLLEKLKNLSKETGLPFAEIVRRAIDEYLRKQK